MTENDRIPELLSPAGSFASAMAAFHAGADAVYLAGNRFGARAYAENFSEDDIIRCIRYAHLYSKKVYLTLNILIKESEIREIEGFVRPLYEAGLDGVIIQDLGIVRLLHDLFPHLPLHASTQMSITGFDGVSFLEKYGISRVVPARELSLNEIESIIAHEDASELECFIHGAMCYCYSGQCLFSSVLGGRSGNRGRCAQPCRLGYEYLGDDHSGSKNGNDLSYILSMKDLCTVDRISELIDAGIASFKIEGRMKSPEYSAGVTSIYRKAIDDHLSGIDHDAKKDVDLLKGLYMRTGIYEGYYDT
ncbi:MAG: U32 family peptidase, partial [Lachnospiraceae bacterium]|nr:U32 family peptidase [Lachnospiraceae bacterium]